MASPILKNPERMNLDWEKRAAPGKGAVNLTDFNGLICRLLPGRNFDVGDFTNWNSDKEPIIGTHIKHVRTQNIVNSGKIRGEGRFESRINLSTKRTGKNQFNKNCDESIIYLFYLMRIWWFSIFLTNFVCVQTLKCNAAISIIRCVSRAKNIFR